MDNFANSQHVWIGMKQNVRRYFPYLLLAALLVLHVIILSVRIKSSDATIFRISLIPAIAGSILLGTKVGVINFILISLFNTYFLIGSTIDIKSNLKSILEGIFICLSISLVLGIFSDMYRKIKALNSQLNALVLTDPLTNLYNRRYFQEVLRNTALNFLYYKSIPEVQKRNIDFADTVMGIFLLDIDHFKQINDTYGHATGDAVLVATAARIKSLLRFDDIVIRWGGEEFLIILPTTKKEYLCTVKDKILSGIKEHKISITGGREITITASIGGVYYPFYRDAPDTISFEQAINFSDYAMYISKKNGRDQLTVISAGTKVYPYGDLLAHLANTESYTELSSYFHIESYYR
jgi:diguanylate cyclase (GGDEF)-like protein